MKPAPFEYLAVDSVEAAVEALGRYDGTARCLAGGQSLVALLNMRLVRPSAVVDLNGISGLDEVQVAAVGSAAGARPAGSASGAPDGHVLIGALARYSALERSPAVAERLPLLARAVPFVGDRQVRNRGTLGGALCHADPSGEMALVAVTLGATLEVTGPSGPRRIAAADFFQGPYTTALEPADVLDRRGAARAQDELGRRRRARAPPRRFCRRQRGRRRRARPGRRVAGRAHRARRRERPARARARRAASAGGGTRLEPEAIRAAAEAALEVADPASDVRASAEYRRHLVPIFVERALQALSGSAPPELPR